MTQEEIKTEVNRHTSNMIRHEGNVLELQKQVKLTQAELDYEQDQLVICQQEIEKYHELLFIKINNETGTIIGEGYIEKDKLK